MVVTLFLAVSLLGSLTIAPVIAQDEVPAAETESADQAVVEAPAADPPAEEPVQPVLPVLQVEQVEQAPVAEQAPATPLTGSLEIRLTDANGVGLSGLFGVTDAAGAYQERWAEGGVALFPALAAGPATIGQLGGTTDYAFDGATPSFIDVPAGGQAVLPIVNAFLDADGDGVGNSVDTCAAGNDAVDTDADGAPDACDATPTGDDDADGVDNATDACPAGDDAVDADESGTADACDEAPDGETPDGDTPEEPVADEAGGDISEEPVSNDASAIVAAVAEEPVVIEGARVTCQQAEAVAPWIKTDLADYPPGARVTLTGGNWVAGQTVEILVEDDGVADAERGPWSHTAAVTASGQGTFSYQFDLAPWFVASYSVVATGECSEARTDFTDSVDGGPSVDPKCVQITPSDIVSPGSYVMFRCQSFTNGPIKFGVSSITSGWQWASQFSATDALAPPAYGSLNWKDVGLADSEASGNDSWAYFFLSPLTNAPGGIGTVSVQVKRPSGTVGYLSNLSAYQPVTTSNFTLACTPTSVTQSPSAANPAQVNCSLAAPGIASTAVVNVTIPSISVPTGWTITGPTPSAGSVTSTTPFTFSFSLTSSCAASATAQPISITSNLSFQSAPVTGPSTSVSIQSAASTTLSTGITSSSMAWTHPYSFSAYPTNTGSLTYSVQASGCGGWNVTVAAGSFVRADLAKSFSASNLTLTSTTTPSGAGISTPVTSGSLDSSLKVLSASASAANGTYSQTLNLNLNVPGATPVGSYTSTVTISASSGP